MLMSMPAFYLNAEVSAPQPLVVPPASSLTWIWSFGYKGSTYEPIIQLGLNASIIAADKRIDQTVGRNNVAFVRSISYQRGSQIHADDIAALSMFVAQRHLYAALVFGWEGLANFNLTTSPSVYNVTDAIASTGVDGIWIDQTGFFSRTVGNTVFNSMMQNLTNQHPNLLWIINYAGGAADIINPLPGTTWANQSYASDSPSSGSVTNFNLNKLAKLEQQYPGRVLMHLDASASNPNAPMSIFSKLNSTSEIRTLTTLVQLGQTDHFSMLFPVIGANSDSNSTYEGTLYNSLDSGFFPRDTFTSWLALMSIGHTYSVTFSENGLPNGTTWRVQIGNMTKLVNNSSVSFSGILYGNKTWIANSHGYIVGNTNVTQGPFTGMLNVPNLSKVNITFSNPTVVYST